MSKETPKENIIKMEISKLKNIVFAKMYIPAPLKLRMFQQRLLAAVVAFITIALTIVEKDITLLIGLAISLFLLFLPLKIKADLISNTIVKMKLVCVHAFYLHKQTKVTFKDPDTDHFYEFYCSTKRNEFVTGTTYIVYFSTHNEKALLCWELN